MATRLPRIRASVTDSWLQRLAQPWQFVGAVWIAIATVLICAVAPAGLPQTTQLGSAFNPATTIVALNSGTGNARLLAKRAIRSTTVDADAAATQQFTSFLTPEPIAALPARIAGETARPVAFDTAVAPARSRTRPWQTGPPAA